MGTLNRALKCLFDHAYAGEKLPPYDQEDAWRHASVKVFGVVAASSGADPKVGITWRDLYTYLSRNIPGGASAKAVDALFHSLDRSSNGAVTADEFTEVVMKRLGTMREERELESRLATAVPRIHVVPGSNRLNFLAKTEAFKVQVVTRAWVRDLGAAWAEMDLDGDGKVSAADLRRYFGRVQPGLLAFLPSIFRAIESRSFASGRSASARPGSRGAGGSGGAGGGGGGGGGAITFQQFLKALYPEASLSDLRTLQAMAADRKSRAVAAAEAVANDKLLAEIQGVFVVFDDDQSGELDEDEFVSAMELTGHTAAEAKGIFQQIDADGSGAVSWDEFRKWYTSSYARYMEESQRRMLDDEAEAPFGYDDA
ncbi:hypothetical protein CHLRE_06g289800v5 [Chlamydomonas reinhardtii]|uniref:EF-hand domain-containing protein n=1 Tax=Chlamydomonas reinhardtii TaxID=3055 RepID=A8J2H0_CHLRE|nr:uncharacterized protein CHLRE_06g289800v5 [Chlamydomonas reinhardtii]PNW82692.1 hypothetical protein CHLRE_06g289800v5 [Chlamydomonas reinhardtii]|eukprot:XP_001695390.1 predicted protein [Chlamydomonas reinhardtii]